MKDVQISPLGDHSIVQKLQFPGAGMKLYGIILIVALLLGIGTGFLFAQGSSKKAVKVSPTSGVSTAKTAQMDSQTFKDFAEGKIEKKPEPKNQQEYSEGTHFLIREKAVPVALTSSVVDLSQYEGKFVKVYGETQRAIKEGWLMDVGKVEEKK